MRVMVNATGLHGGGGVQVASGFISQAAALAPSVPWCFAVSEMVAANLDPTLASGAELNILDMRPRQPAKARKVRGALSRLEAQFRPDVVFTVFGPPYWNPLRPHVCGFAVPWVIFGGGGAWEVIPPVERPLVWSVNRYRMAKLSRRWFYWTETSSAAAALARRLHIRPDHVFVIPNGPHPAFVRAASTETEYLDGGREPFTLLCLSAYYPHKNLELIPHVAKALQALGHDAFVFQVTLPREGRGWLRIAATAAGLGVSEHIQNIGPQRISDCPTLYARASAAFLPSLLEVFSAVYVESSFMKRPLVTTDIAASREVCGDAALYFPPFDSQRAAQQVARLMTDQAFYRERQSACAAIVAGILSPTEKFRLTMRMLNKVAIHNQVAE